MRGVKKRLKEAGEVKNTPIYLSPLSALLNVVKKKQNDFPKRFLWNVLQQFMVYLTFPRLFFTRVEAAEKQSNLNITA